MQDQRKLIKGLQVCPLKFTDGSALELLMKQLPLQPLAVNCMAVAIAHVCTYRQHLTQRSELYKYIGAAQHK